MIGRFDLGKVKKIKAIHFLILKIKVKTRG